VSRRRLVFEARSREAHHIHLARAFYPTAADDRLQEAHFRDKLKPMPNPRGRSPREPLILLALTAVALIVSGVHPEDRTELSAGPGVSVVREE
jgi:hypothetical protein